MALIITDRRARLRRLESYADIITHSLREYRNGDNLSPEERKLAGEAEAVAFELLAILGQLAEAVPAYEEGEAND